MYLGTLLFSLPYVLSLGSEFQRLLYIHSSISNLSVDNIAIILVTVLMSSCSLSR